MARHATCNLGHRIRRTIAIDGLELDVYQCCDSRECLFKSVEGGMMFCRYSGPPGGDQDRVDGIKDQHHKEAQ